MKAVLESGLDVPNDVAIVGCGDVTYADFMRVPLTSINQQSTEIGERFMPTQRLTAAAHVLASYDAAGGGAFLIESAYGRGRVALVTSSLGAST